MGAQELLILGAIGFLLFGAKKLPELARSLGSSVVEFKKGLKSEDDPTPSEGRDSAALPPGGGAASSEARPS